MSWQAIAGAYFGVAALLLATAAWQAWLLARRPRFAIARSVIALVAMASSAAMVWESVRPCWSPDLEQVEYCDPAAWAAIKVAESVGVPTR